MQAKVQVQVQGQEQGRLCCARGSQWGAAARASGLALLAVLGLLAPLELAAQGYQGSVRFEPYGGAWFDDLRNERGSGNPGWLGGVRVGYETGYALAGMERSLRLVVDAARAETEKAGVVTVDDTVDLGFRSEWWLLTAGLEWDVLPGWSGASIDLRGGAAWQQSVITHASAGFDPDSTTGTTASAEYERYPAAAVGVSIYRHLSPLFQLRLRAEDVLVDPFGEARHNPAITLGLRFVFD